MWRLVTQPALRRGLIVALDGLAIWLLAFVLAAYADPDSVAGSSGDLIPTAIDTTVLWATTPGVGVFELLAVIGLVITMLGPVWFWIVQPGFERGWYDRLMGTLWRRGDEFRYDRLATSSGGSSGGFRRDRIGSDDDRGPRGEHPDGDPIADLFDSKARSSGSFRVGPDRSADESPTPSVDDDSATVAAGKPDESPTDEILVEMNDGEESVDVEMIIESDGTADGGEKRTSEDTDDGVATGDAETGFEYDGPAAESSGVEEADPIDAEATSEERTAGGSVEQEPDDDRTDPELGVQSTVAESTAESSVDGTESSISQAKNMDAVIDNLRSNIEASRARIDTASDRIAETVDSPATVSFRAALESLTTSADSKIEPLRSIGSGESVQIAERISEIRAAQRSIEADVDAFVKRD